MYASIYRERYGPEEASIKKEGENTTISSLIYLSPINTAEVSGGSETKNDSGCGSDWRAKAFFFASSSHRASAVRLESERPGALGEGGGGGGAGRVVRDFFRGGRADDDDVVGATGSREEESLRGFGGGSTALTSLKEVVDGAGVLLLLFIEF